MNWYQRYHQVEHSFIQPYQKPTQIQGTSTLVWCLSEQKNALLNVVLKMLLPGKFWTTGTICMKAFIMKKTWHYKQVSQLPSFKTFSLVSTDKSASCAALSYATNTMQQVLFLWWHWLFHFNTKHLWSCYSTVACKMMWKMTEDVTDGKLPAAKESASFLIMWIASLFNGWANCLDRTGPYQRLLQHSHAFHACFYKKSWAVNILCLPAFSFEKTVQEMKIWSWV
jgi:hypothetical protein